MRFNGVAAVGVALLLVGLSGGSAWAAARGGDPEIRVLSNRADLVSGGDALVQVVVPAGANPLALSVSLDGRDVTSAFGVRPDGRYLGVVEGLREGRNVITVRLPNGRGARLALVNHPLGGPVTSGPQIQPWKCFAGATDAQCNRPVKYEFLYKSTRGGGLQAYEPQRPASDVASTTTDQGKTVPFIVRQETGAIDRDEYRIAVLYDPRKPWPPWAPQDGFNRKLVITHGASCDTSYGQASAPAVLNETALSRGFAVMSNALDNAGHNCNIATQAESLIMTKEHLVDTYGDVRYTIGSGCSGGALTQQQVANAYPGLYQGITPACSFPDAWSSAMLYVDYLLLRQYFEQPSRWEPGVAWSADDIQAVEGHPNPVNAVTFTTAIPFSGEPTRSCPSVPSAQVYDERTNPTGVRCTLQDYMVNVFGVRDPSVWGAVEKQIGRGFAGRPFDNVGLEYGRKALLRGAITPAQFVDLNAKVGSGNIDADYQAERTAADRPALERVYRSGAVNQGTHLDKVAIIDLRGPDPGAFHDVYRTYALRARLDREHGRHDNQVLWRGQVPLLGDTGYTDQSILAVDRWLAAVEADPRDLPLAEKLVQDKPPSVRDRCTNGGGQELPPEECDAVVQSYTTARIEADMPFTDDTIKCELQPLRRSNHLPVLFSDAEWGKLEKAFPDGVCDYSKAGVDRVPTVPWLTYEDGPGGRPLGPSPASEPARFAASRCQPRRMRVGLRGIGAIRLGDTRRKIESRVGGPAGRGRGGTLRYCVNGGGKVLVAFNRRGRADLIATTASQHGARRVSRGTRTLGLRRAYPGLRRLQRGLYRSTGRTRKLFAVRRGRVRFVAVVDRRLLRQRRSLVRQLRSLRL